jgi:1-deoxy-D-xylulose-5-phosphate reductoisomerase
VNAADEVAVHAFLERRIAFSDIPRLIAAALDAHRISPTHQLEPILEADAWARDYARRQIG